MDAYSIALALALVAGGVGLLAVFSGRARDPASLSHRLGRIGGIVGLILVLAAVVIHVLWGHRPGSPQALGPIRFAVEHPALMAAALMALVAIRGARSG